jgi:mannose-6-phosphate isomerase-like protein (cupin superfamily)
MALAGLVLTCAATGSEQPTGQGGAEVSAAPAPAPAPAAAAAAAAAKPTVLYLSGKEVAGRIRQGDADAKAGKPFPSSTLPSWGPYQGHLGYRTSPQPLIYTNDDFAEYWFILDGEGTISLGGTLLSPKRIGPHAEAATVQGATDYKVAKGDMVMMPPGLAHAITQVRGKLVYVSMHLQLQADPATGAPAR